MRKAKDLGLGFAAGVVLATVGVAGLLQAQPAAQTPVPVTQAPTSAQTASQRPIAQVPGSVQVTRLTDTTFIVVKDQGDAQVVTLFTTEQGLVQKKHSGRFLY